MPKAARISDAVRHISLRRYGLELGGVQPPTYLGPLPYCHKKEVDLYQEFCIGSESRKAKRAVPRGQSYACRLMPLRSLGFRAAILV